MSQLTSFSRWMKEVDQKVNAISGLGCGDLPDVAFRDMFDDEVPTGEAAETVLEAADFPVELSF